MIARRTGAGAALPDASKRPMVLVHGGWRGGWSWRRVAVRLRAAGHPVFAPTLTGLGDRSHLLSPKIGLSMHIQDVMNLIEWEDLSDVVLCGHSYGGMVTTAVAARLRPRLRSLVYLDAFLPKSGTSLFDHLPEAMRCRFLAAAAAAGGDTVPPPSAASFLVNEADRAWVDAKCTPQPLKTFLEPVGFVDGFENVVTKIYVSATKYNSAAFAPFVHRVASDPSWTLIGIEAGHDLMIDEPDKVAEILLSAAG